MAFKNIDEALNWVMSQRNKDFKFSEFKQLCTDLGNPQNGFYTVHIAGTNGKGSTVAYLRDLLMAYGYKVGTYTSPHYVTHQDRIRINNENIPDDVFLRLINKRYDLYTGRKMTMFEIDYLIMCDYFKEENVDFAIVEVGLGGRLDATNAVDDTKLSVITTIGYDHMERLGDTLEKITYEKCGIIKNNSKVLVGHLDDSYTEVAKKTAEERNSEFIKLSEITDLGDRKFVFENSEYQLGSYAKYQMHNASLALKALAIVFDDLGINNNIDINKKVLLESLWQCRFQIVKENPRVILDGGHNAHGIHALVESFDQFEGSKCIIFSALKRKEYMKMVEELKLHCDELIITTFKNNEVITLDEFKNEVCYENYQDAVDYAVNKYDNILICGSLYFMSELVLNCRF